MVRKNPDEYQWWGFVDEETMVWKYDFEGEIYVDQRDSKLDQRPGLILEKEIAEAPKNVKMRCGNDF